MTINMLRKFERYHPSETIFYRCHHSEILLWQRALLRHVPDYSVAIRR